MARAKKVGGFAGRFRHENDIAPGLIACPSCKTEMSVRFDAFTCYSAVKGCLTNCLLLVAMCIPIQYLRSYNDSNPVGGPDQRCQKGVTAWVENSLEFRLRLQPSRVS